VGFFSNVKSFSYHCTGAGFLKVALSTITLTNFSQSEHIIGPGSHVEYPTGTKTSNFVEDHPRNIPAKFGSNWPRGFGKE
jgi:hypothetical protein